MSVAKLDLCYLSAVLFRITLEGAVIVGFFKKQSQARWASIVFSTLAFVLITAVAIYLFGTEGLIPKEAEANSLIMMMIVVIQDLVFLTIIGCLLTPSAARHFKS